MLSSAKTRVLPWILGEMEAGKKPPIESGQLDAQRRVATRTRMCGRQREGSCRIRARFRSIESSTPRPVLPSFSQHPSSAPTEDRSRSF